MVAWVLEADMAVCVLGADVAVFVLEADVATRVPGVDFEREDMAQKKARYNVAGGCQQDAGWAGSSEQNCTVPVCSRRV